MTKERVFALLRGNEEGFLSGQALSDALGVTRAAVWKAIAALRAEGYAIEARSGSGYRLLASPDRLSEREIRACLGPVKTVGRALCCLESVDSTNTYLMLRGAQGAPDGLVAAAETQTAGRGRAGGAFPSARGQGVYLSALMRLMLTPEEARKLPPRAAEAVRGAVERVCGLRAEIRSPDDLLADGKKFGGILTELSVEAESGTTQFAVVGVGLRTGRTADEGETTLACALKRPVRRAALAAAVIEALDALYERMQSEP